MTVASDHPLISQQSISQNAVDWLIAALITSVILAMFAFIYQSVRGWFLLPLFACGVLIIPDAIAWLRGRFDLYDPIGIIGVIGTHFFLLTPLMHIGWNMWHPYVTPLDDWPGWIGRMAIVNAMGLAIYRGVRQLVPLHSHAPHLRVRTELFPLVLGVALLATFAVQIVVYAQFGGISGYIQTYESDRMEFVGMGWIFTISESFPILLLMGWAVYNQRRERVPSWMTIAVVLIIFLVLKLLFGGLRGSRSNTIWGLFWAVGIIHFVLRRFPKLVIYGGLIFVLLFMYAYGFYKAGGVAGLRALTDDQTRITLQRTHGRTFEALLLGDLGRADVQSYVLARTWDSGSYYELAMGRTYLGAVALAIPRSVWPERPPTKWWYGTQALYGQSITRRSSNIYGLAGEGLLNFGLAGALIAFVAFGLLVGGIRRYTSGLAPGDIRWMIIPMLAILCVTALVGDSDNIFFFLVKNGAIPLTVIWAASRRIRTTR